MDDAQRAAAELKAAEEQKQQEADEATRQRQEAEQAVVPPPPPTFIQKIIEENKQKAPLPENEEKILLEGAGSDFWRILKNHIEMNIKKLDQSLAERVRSMSPNMEEIGMRYVLHDQITNALKDVINIVEWPVQIKARQDLEAQQEGGKSDDAT